MKTLAKLIAQIFAVLAAAFSLSAFAQENGTPAPLPQVELAQSGAQQVLPALWKVSDEDTTIYLFGTIHVLPEGIDWFDGKVAAAFAKSDMLVTEIVEEDAAKVQALVIEKAMLANGRTLRSLLSKDQKAAYEAALAELHVPPALFDRFEPWYTAVALSTLPLMQAGYASENGVEGGLEKRALERKMPHTALETSEHQLSLFDGLPMDVQQRYLAEVVEQLPTIKAELASMIDAWKSGKAETLAKLMNAEESDPVLVRTLLTDRNKAWAEWIDARMDKPGTVFLAVGAGHLAGPGSLQDQLVEVGFVSERLQ